MSNWWYVLAIVVIAAAVILFLRYRGRSRGGGVPLASRTGIGPNRNYAQEREEARVGRMSEEDQAWESASLERNREEQAGREPPPGSS
jgi:hypothetical protein